MKFIAYINEYIPGFNRPPKVNFVKKMFPTKRHCAIYLSTPIGTANQIVKLAERKKRDEETCKAATSVRGLHTP
jgi:hypothetical protein